MSAPRSSHGLAITVLTVALAAAGCGRPCAPLELYADGSLVLTLCATRTQTEAELRGGLSLRPPLAPDEALVLVFPLETEACIANAPVDYAIDAAFLDMQGTVVALERSIPAHDETSRCHLATARVVEARAEVLRDVRVGDVAPAAR